MRKYDNRECGGSPLLANEIANHLKRPTEKDHGLDSFPTIKKLYFKFNCISCNEADVERVFSYAGTPANTTNVTVGEGKCEI